MELEELRRGIDAVDEQLIRLFAERMELSARVARYKQAQGLPTFDPERERELLARVAALAGPELAPYCGPWFAALIAQSRTYQQQLRGER